MHSRLRVIFFGLGGYYALVPLRTLIAEHEVVAVYSDRRPVAKGHKPGAFGGLGVQVRAGIAEAGRRLLGAPPAITLASVAGAANIPYRQVDTLNAPEVVEELRAYEPDVICIASLNRILKPPVLGVPRLGVINAHNALLPGFRGPNPFFWMVKLGVLRGGCTLHWAEPEVDSGRILARGPVQIYLGMTPAEYADALGFQIGTLYHTLLGRLAAGERLQGEENPPPTTPYCRNPRPEDLELSSAYTCTHALWFHQIARSYGVPFVRQGGAIIRCPTLMRNTSQGGTRVEFADGLLWTR